MYLLTYLRVSLLLCHMTAIIVRWWWGLVNLNDNHNDDNYEERPPCHLTWGNLGAATAWYTQRNNEIETRMEGPQSCDDSTWLHFPANNRILSRIFSPCDCFWFAIWVLFVLHQNRFTVIFKPCLGPGEKFHRIIKFQKVSEFFPNR